jgi:hypothetical protein
MKKKSLQKSKFTTAMVIPLILVLAACGSFLDLSISGVTKKSNDTSGIMETMTARATQGGSDSEVATAFAKATAYNQELTANALLNQSNYQGTATANAPILQELSKYGVNPNMGWVAWVHDPVTFDLTGYQEYEFANDYPEVTGKDFVLAADITWNTEYGSSGCGFVFRSDGDKEEPNQYMVMITRFAEGSLAYSALSDGALVNTKNYYPSAFDDSFSWENDATNRLVIVARQEMLTFYTNGEKVGEIDILNPPPESVPQARIPTLPANATEAQRQQYEQQLRQYGSTYGLLQGNLLTAQQNYNQYAPAYFYDGFLSFMAFTQSGETECTFNNAWLFTIDTPPTATPNLTWTATITPTPTRTYIPTKTLTRTEGPTDAPTLTLIPSLTFTPSATVPSLTPGPSNTPSTPAPTNTPTTPPPPTNTPTTPAPTSTPETPTDTPTDPPTEVPTG